MALRSRVLRWLFAVMVALVVAGCGDGDNAASGGVIDRQVLAGDNGLGSAHVTAVAERGRVRSGRAFRGSWRHGGGIWWSDDGDSWTRVPHDDALFGERTALSVAPVEIFEVVATEDSFLAVGGIKEPVRADRPLVWRSEDGRTWTRGPYDSDLEFAYIRAVASFNGGLVAVGLDNEHTAGSGVVWRSADGTNWEVAFRPPEQFFDVVTVGSLTEPVLFAVTDSAIHYSTDARTWEQARSLGTWGGIEAIPEVGVVIDGVDGQLIASSDGLTWVKLTVPHPQGERVSVTAAVDGDGMSVLFGETYVIPEDPTPCGGRAVTGTWLWASTNGGETWKALEMAPPPPWSPTRAIVTDGQILLLGETLSFVDTDQIRSTPSALFDEPTLAAQDQSASPNSTGC